MSEREECALLLDVAERDLGDLRHLRDPGACSDELFGFVAQQSLEKCLKAWLCLLGARYPFIHDLTELLMGLQQLGQEVDDFWDLVDFNPFAVEFRYASQSSGDAPLDREHVIERVEALHQRVSDVAAGLDAES